MSLRKFIVGVHTSMISIELRITFCVSGKMADSADDFKNKKSWDNSDRKKIAFFIYSESVPVVISRLLEPKVEDNKVSVKYYVFWTKIPELYAQ